MPNERFSTTLLTPVLQSILTILALTAGSIAIITTLLSLLRAKAWWIRIWDFPRLQLGILALGALGLWSLITPSWAWPHSVFALALAGAAIFQAMLVWRYTPLAPHEVQDSRSTDRSSQLSLVVSNVLQSNRQSDRLLSVIRSTDPDVILFCEVDEWWLSRLDALSASHPYSVRHPLSNTYGLLLCSRLELHDERVDFLTHPTSPQFRPRSCCAAGSVFGSTACTRLRPSGVRATHRRSEIRLCCKSDGGFPKRRGRLSCAAI